MKVIYLTFIISYLSFIANKEFYYNVSKDNFNEKYDNLEKGNKYNFVFPAKLNEQIHIDISIDYIIENISKIINIYDYKKYTSNFINRTTNPALNYNYNYIKKDNITDIYFSSHISNKEADYDGIELIPNNDFNCIVLTIVTENRFNLEYNREYKSHFLYKHIPYVYSFDVYNNFVEDVNFTVTSYLISQPFKKIIISEFYLNNSYKINEAINVNFTEKNHMNTLSHLYKIRDFDMIKYITFEFLPDYFLWNLILNINGTKKYKNRQYYNVTKGNFNHKYNKLKKDIIYDFVFPADEYSIIYSSISTKYNLLNNNNTIFKSITIYEYSSYILNNIDPLIIDSIPLEYKKRNNEILYDFHFHAKNAKYYYGIEIKLNYDIDYLNISLISSNKIDLEYNKLNTRTLYENIPYIYNFDTSKIPKDILNVVISVFIPNKNIGNKHFKTFNITEYQKENNYPISKVINYNFKEKNDILEFSFSYKINNTNILSRNISFDFISNYQFEDFKIIVTPRTEFYFIDNINNFKEKYLNFIKEKIYVFVFPAKLGQIFYSTITTHYINSNSIFKSITPIYYERYESNNRKSRRGQSINPRSKKNNTESIINFETYLIYNNCENYKYLGIELKLNNDIDYLIFNLVSASEIKINLIYNQINSRKIYPFIPYYFYIDNTQKSNETINFIISTKYISNKPFKTYNITEYINENIYYTNVFEEAIFNKNNETYELNISYKIQNYKTTNISLDFISDYELENFNIEVKISSDSTSENIGPNNKKILGFSVLAFFLAITGAFIFIAAIIIGIILFKKKRTRNNADERKESIASINQEILFPSAKD